MAAQGIISAIAGIVQGISGPLSQSVQNTDQTATDRTQARQNSANIATITRTILILALAAIVVVLIIKKAK